MKEKYFEIKGFHFKSVTNNTKKYIVTNTDWTNRYIQFNEKSIEKAPVIKTRGTYRAKSKILFKNKTQAAEFLYNFYNSDKVYRPSVTNVANQCTWHKWEIVPAEYAGEVKEVNTVYGDCLSVI